MQAVGGFDQIPVTDEMVARSIGRVALGVALDCGIRGRKITLAAFESELMRSLRKACGDAALRAYTLVRATSEYRAARWWVML